MKTPTKKGRWWKSFYEDTPFELYLARNDQAELAASIAFLTDKLQLKAGDVIFDQCCGPAGMSIPLAKLGFSLIGVDLCEKYIAMAKAEAEAGGISASFSVGDAFAFLPPVPCDAVFNWYTSFGYSEDDRQNIKMVARAFEALKPGGWFALDFLNMPMILTAFKTTMTTKLHSPTGDIVQARRCTLDLHRGLMEQNWTWTMPGGKQLKQNSTLRAYMPCDLVKMFAEVGFEEVQLFGNIDGQPLTSESGRCIVLGRRPL
jgi:SAM-dependent methyltransferase